MALLTAATWWLRLALASRPLGSFLCPWFPSNTDIVLSKTGSKVGAACKAAAEFSQECSWLFKEPPRCFSADCQLGSHARRCSNLLWDSSAPSCCSGVEELCAVALAFWSGRRPRGWGPQRARGLSPLRRSGSKPSLFRLISEYGQLT